MTRLSKPTLPIGGYNHTVGNVRHGQHIVRTRIIGSAVVPSSQTTTVSDGLIVVLATVRIDPGSRCPPSRSFSVPSGA